MATAYYTQPTSMPAIPMTTYVTTCPPEWGFQGPVTVTIPVTVTVGKPSNVPNQSLTVNSVMMSATAGASWVDVNGVQSKATAVTTGSQGWVDMKSATVSSDATYTQAAWSGKPQSNSPAMNSWASVQPATASMSGDASKTAWETLSLQSVSPTTATQAWQFWTTETTKSPQDATATGMSTGASDLVKTYTGGAGKMLPVGAAIVSGLAMIFGLISMV